MEKKLFHILVENKGRTISMELLERAIWGMSGDAIHLRQLVARLRKKLPENTIQNKTGSGYCIV
jgi:DNA-binding response OmpR family regulator